MKPVAYILRNEYNEYRLEPMDDFDIKTMPVEVEIPLVPKREWVGLTEEDVNELCCTFMGQFNKVDFIKAIEAKLKEKNTQEPIKWSDYESDGRIIKNYPEKDKT
jgi:hypothetical protein